MADFELPSVLFYELFNVRVLFDLNLLRNYIKQHEIGLQNFSAIEHVKDEC